MSNNDIAGKVGDILNDYAYEVKDSLSETIKEVSNAAKDIIKQNAPVGNSKKHYRAGWKVKFQLNARGMPEATIYNKTKYRVAHLLENGHAKVNGGRVPGKPHIKPAADWAERELIKQIGDKI